MTPHAQHGIRYEEKMYKGHALERNGKYIEKG